MAMLERISAGPSERRRNNERRRLKRADASGAGLSISRDGRVDAALCGDVTTSGVRLTLERPPAIGETVQLNLGPDLTLIGRVAWVENSDCGIEFDKAVDADLLNLPAVADRRSGRGLSRSTGSGFRDGLNVTVVLPHCERKAVLHWTDDHRARFSFKA